MVTLRTLGFYALHYRPHSFFFFDWRLSLSHVELVSPRRWKWQPRDVEELRVVFSGSGGALVFVNVMLEHQPLYKCHLIRGGDWACIIVVGVVGRELRCRCTVAVAVAVAVVGVALQLRFDVPQTCAARFIRHRSSVAQHCWLRSVVIVAGSREMRPFLIVLQSRVVNCDDPVFRLIEAVMLVASFEEVLGLRLDRAPAVKTVFLVFRSSYSRHTVAL
jgi:hypothetical protein